MGTFKVQQGMLSTTTQFWAFQLKAWFALTSSPAFTKAERVRMGLGMGLLWGATGYGVIGEEVFNEYDKLTGGSTPEPLKQVIQHGIADKFVNDFLTMVFGKDEKGRGSDVALSESGSPLSGIGLPYSALMDDKNLFEFASGVSGYTFSAYGNAISLAVNMWNQPDLSTSEKASKSILNLLSVFPLVSNAQRGIMALNMHRHISKSTLSSDEQITAGEALTLGLTGFMSRKELDVIEDRMTGKKRKLDSLDIGKTTARITNDKMMHSIAEHGTLTTEDWQNIQDTINVVAGTMLPGAKKEFRKGFRQYLNGLPRDKDSLHQYFQSILMLGDDKEADIASIKRSSRFTEQEKEQLIKLVDGLWDNQELAQGALGNGR